MPRKLSIMALGLVLCVAQAVAQGAPQGAGRAAGPTQVGVVSLTRESVPVAATLPGRAVAFQQTAIRPQVGGEVREIAYRAGEPVEVGTVLFRLDDETLAATLASAESAVTSARAAVQGAQATVNRYDRLAGSGVSRAELESSQVALANAEAALSAAVVQRDLAQLQLDHAEITSPIAGIPDLARVAVGDIVTASQADVLTTVTQLDPIYVDVSESRARLLRDRERRETGTMARPAQRPEAQLILETGQAYGPTGRIVAPGVAVSPTTGTVPIRFEFQNPDRMILPGQFVRLKIIVGAVDGVLVPQRATSRAPNGALTAFIARDGKAAEVTLTENGVHENAWVVTSGVAAGDALILDGLDNLRDGAEIQTVPVTIDADGVVRDADDGGTPAPAAASGGTADAPANAAAPPNGAAEPAAASAAPETQASAPAVQSDATGQPANASAGTAGPATSGASGNAAPDAPATPDSDGTATTSAPDAEAPMPEGTTAPSARPVPQGAAGTN